MTSKTTATPGVRNTCQAPARCPGACPGKSGTARNTHSANTTEARVTSTKVARQPSHSPSQVPTGTPSDSAIGAPTMATAIALPWRATGTMRRACPAISPHAKPAAAPVRKRATRVRPLDSEIAVKPLNTMNPAIASSSVRRRHQPWVRVTKGIAVSNEPKA
ncbi:hypothetical protein D3C76_1382200 [compost metagenome]